MNKNGTTEKGRNFYLGSAALFVLAIALAFGAALSGFGTRLGLWQFNTGFKLLKYCAYGGLLTGILSIVIFYMSFGRRLKAAIIISLAAISLGSAVFVIPFSWAYKAKRVPPIHDITTDTQNPPEFKAVLPLRPNTNDTRYGGTSLALKQKASYPYVRPLILNMPAPQAYISALQAARKMGWEIVEANERERRIEATDTTFWFGFKDDVVIRLTPVEGNARTVVDVRSASREGVSDIGTNAERIRRYLDELA